MENKDLENKEEKVDNNLKNRCIVGFMIGIAIIVPGVSGAMIAIMFKLYDKIINAVATLFKTFKKNLLFLLPIIIFAAIGVILGFFSIKKLLELIPFAITCLFAGLLLGGIPELKEEKIKYNFINILIFVIGLIIPILMALLSIFSTLNMSISNYTFINYLILFIVGIIVAITQFVPGCSASAFLISIGLFNNLMNSVSLTYFKETPMIFTIYASLILGFIFGCFLSAITLNKLIKKYHVKMSYLFMGLSLGSVVSILIGKDNMDIYKTWANSGINYLDLILGITLFIIGLTLVILFIHLTKKKRGELI